MLEGIEIATIMIVDDAAFMRALLKKILLQYGHEVVAEAGNGDEAVEKYQQYKPDIVLLDIIMPAGSKTKDGIDTLQKIMEIDPHAKIIMCSSMGQQALVVEALKCGAKDFIVKPFQPQKVMEVLNKWC